jgi:hypothetical protein
MADPFKIVYTFRFEDDTKVQFNLLLDHATLALSLQQEQALPDWALLKTHKCRICLLDERKNRYCPVAACFSGVVERFKNHVSHDRVIVHCVVEERTYSKQTTLQMGVSPLLGIIMTTSGCPVMEQLKPMVRFHLPFASLEETIFRMVSMHLVSQYLRKQAGKPAEWSLDGLSRIYGQVGQINDDFAERLATAGRSDVNVNALVNLDAFAKMVPLAADNMLKKITPYFSALLK